MKGLFSWLLGLLLFGAPAARAQFCYTTNNGEITLTGYTGGSGAVTVSNFVRCIGAGAFSNCTPLTMVTIPDGVTRIGDNAFVLCTSLTNVAIGIGVTNIGVGAFSHCINLSHCAMGGSTLTIGDYAFCYCVGLSNIIIADSVANIGDHAFENCLNLTNASLGDGVGRIGNGAFYSCTRLAAVTIPDSVTNIEALAFYNCSELPAVTIGRGVVSIGGGALGDCAGLSAINVDALNTNFASAGGVLFNRNQTMLIQYPAGNAAASYAVPDSVGAIGDEAFYNCGNLTNVTIGRGVTNIGKAPFCNCGQLRGIAVASGNAAYCSMGGVLFNSNQTTLVEFPPGNAASSYAVPNSVRVIGDWAFAYCTTLPSVTIPNTVLNIGGWAFAYCIDLNNLTIPNSVTNLGDDAFVDCGGLSSVTIPSNVRSIGRGVFQECNRLTNVMIGPGVTNIGAAPFLYCTRLAAIGVDGANPDYMSVGGVLYTTGQTALIQYPPGRTAATYSVPRTVTSIGESACAGCASLAQIYFAGNAPSADDSVFTSDTTTVYYLPGTSGWGSSYGGRPAVLWNPTIQTASGNFGVRTNCFGFSIVGASNLSFVVETCNVSNRLWQCVCTNRLTNGMYYFSDRQWTNSCARFYRIAAP